MVKKGSLLKFAGIAAVIILAGIVIYRYYAHSINITSIELKSPNNYAFQEEVNVVLDKPAAIEIRYWKEGSSDKFRTIKTATALEHSVNLLLLETNTTYNYQVIIKRLVNVYSKVLSFHTPEQSPWLQRKWVDPDAKYDAGALADGLVMLCNARLPGFITMLDAKGAVRWYWQIDDIGVRAATFTPRGTILAMLRPPMKDVIDDTPKDHAALLNDLEKPIRRGEMGFAGGTGIAEIDLNGKLLWRLDMDKAAGGKYKIIHHDVRMDKYGHIVHINCINFDTDGNYLVSVAIEDQIWKINAKTGKIMWKLGKDGDFKMDTTCYFSFQHSVHINPQGDLMVFDNSLWKKVSGGVSFKLDTVNKTAKTVIKATLPPNKYTSRMGSAYLLPNGKLLQTSSKTGCVMVTDQQGKILWELNSYFVPYRAEYVPASIWENYFTRD